MPSCLHLSAVLALAALSVTAAGCGGAEVKVAFDHQTSTAGPGRALTEASTQPLTVDDGHTLTVFGMKLVTIYLVEDRDENMDNVGHVARIWMNPACDAEGTRCSISAEGGGYQIKEFFDLALPTAEVNTRLNSQGSSIKAGTYRFLNMDLAGPMKTDDRSATNLRFGSSTASHEVRLNDNRYLIALDPPMVVADGDAVTVTLGYNMRGSYFDSADLDGFHPPPGTALQDWYCGDTSHSPARGPCLSFAGFLPAVWRNGE
jgi:hypothetical protein